MNVLDNMYLEEYKYRPTKQNIIALWIYDEKTKKAYKYLETYKNDLQSEFGEWYVEFEPKIRDSYVKKNICYQIKRGNGFHKPTRILFLQAKTALC